MIAVEEATGEIQPWNDGNAASQIIRERFQARLNPELLFSLFGHGFIVNPELDGARTIGQLENRDGWYRVFDVGTEDDMNDTEAALRLLAEEEVVGEIVSSNIFFIGTQEERQPWINGAGTEVGNMVSNEAWDEVRVGHLHEDLGLPLSHKLPRVLPMTLVCSRKPLVMQSDQSDNAIENPQSATAVKEQEKLRFKPKVRLCVCGNFEEVHPEMKDANAAETVPIEILRLIASLLAMNPGWSALSLDICAAFRGIDEAPSGIDQARVDS